MCRAPTAARSTICREWRRWSATTKTTISTTASHTPCARPPAWREWAARPGVGAYARRWLAEHGEEVAEPPGDQAWLTVEAFTAASTAFPPELTSLLLGAVLGDTDAGELAENLALMSASGHPDAARLVESVAAATRIRPPAPPPAPPAGGLHQPNTTLH